MSRTAPPSLAWRRAGWRRSPPSSARPPRSSRWRMPPCRSPRARRCDSVIVRLAGASACDRRGARRPCSRSRARRSAGAVARHIVNYNTASRRGACIIRAGDGHVQRRSEQAGFLKGAGLVASGVLGDVLPEIAAAQAQGQAGTALDEQGARFRAVLPPASPFCSRSWKASCWPGLCELEGFQRRVHGRQRHGGEERLAEHQHPDRPGSHRLRNAGDVEHRPADRGRRRERRRQPGDDVSHRSATGARRRGGDHARGLDGPGERATAARGVAMAPKDVMVGRIKAAVDARRDAEHDDHGAMRPAGEGATPRRKRSTAGALYRRRAPTRSSSTGFTLDQQQRAKSRVEEAADDRLERAGGRMARQGRRHGLLPHRRHRHRRDGTSR